MAIGCYTPQYLPASFKGVAFTAMEASSEHGRRGAEGEFPFGESTAYADLGRKIRHYSISGRFQQNSHILGAAALIAVCETTGPGVLLHPTRGVIASAACVSLKVSDKVEEEQGVTYVDLEFVEANNWPNGLSLVGQLLGLIVSPLITALRSVFKGSYQLGNIQPFRVAGVLATARDAVNVINGIYQNVTESQSADVDRNRIVADLTTVANDVDMLSDPTTADRAISLGLNAIALEIEGVEKYNTFRRIANEFARTSAYAAPAGDAENAVYGLIRGLSAVYMAEGALEAVDSPVQDVFARMDVTVNLIQQEMTFARALCYNELFVELSKFRDDVMSNLAAKAYTSSGVVQYNFSGRVHPLVAAYAIHGDAKRHRELETLNVLGAAGRIGDPVNSLVF